VSLFGPRFFWQLALLGPALAATSAAAQAPASDGSLSSASASSSIGLSVEASGLEVDESAVRAAISRELALPSSSGSGSPQLRVTLRVVRDADLTVTYAVGDAAGVSRSVAAPRRSDEVPEVTALLVGNLARDEASGLLLQLRQASPPTPTPAPPTLTSAAQEPAPPLLSSAVNLSLFYPLALHSDSEQRRFALDLGLFYSRSGALSGVAGTLGGVARVDTEANGLLFGGVGYWHEGSGAGLRLGGALGVAEGDYVGVSLAGAVLVQQGGFEGLELAGALDLSTGPLSGAQLSGALGVTGGLEGAQLSGALSVARDVAGAQVSGAVSLARGDVAGAQISGALNLAERVQGLQLSLINIGGDVDGVQLGLINIARDVTGVQLGFVNVAHEVSGVSLGVVPYSQQGRTQVVLWSNSHQLFNLGVRFQSGAIYAMPTFGYASQGGALAFAAGGSHALGLSLGVRLPIDAFFTDLDVNYSNSSKNLAFDENNVDMRYRALAGYQVLPKLSVFVGGGVRHHFRTQGPSEQSVDPELSLGIQVL
jgi:hypothetical protein